MPEKNKHCIRTPYSGTLSLDRQDKTPWQILGATYCRFPPLQGVGWCFKGGQQMPAGGVCTDRAQEVTIKACKGPSNSLTFGERNGFWNDASVLKLLVCTI